MPLLFSKKGKKEGNYRLVSLTSSPRKLEEQLILENISRHMKEKKSSGGVVSIESCLTNLTSFHSEMTILMDEEGAVDIVFLNLSKTFDTVLIDPHREAGV